MIELLEKNQLSPDDQLPPERRLAQLLRVNRSTVTRAFDELVVDGVLERRIGSGTFISQQMYPQKKRVNWHTYLNRQKRHRIQIEQRHIRALIEQQAVNLIDVYSSELPLALVPQFQFPALTWQDFITAQTLETTHGYLPLIEAINQLDQHNEQLAFSEDQFLITAGVQQSLFLILQGLLVPGDAVAIESPSFFHDSTLFETTGIRVYEAPIDADGIELSALEQLVIQHRIKLLILNPDYQNPTGQVMSLGRRYAVIKLCQRYQIPIVEDNIFAWLGFNPSKQLPSLKQLDPENVIYISSLSKIMGASSRIGWVVATPQVIEQLIHVQRETDLVPSITAQVMVTLAMGDPHFQVQLDQLKRILQKRAQATYQMLTQVLPEWQVTLPSGGYYIWVTRDKDQLRLKSLLAHQLAVAPGSLFGFKTDALRINFARLDAPLLGQLAQRLRTILADYDH
ncbi:bacterial regulatory s, gntR family protein [Latilactobacillus graminis DSM 20719]|uniref:Bacterial regulatory s, gntR family protein n=1 Tax=Latilactobacillus graminis DSM 20719 TaxID=1423752 RepID=A0AA89I046_9LACO|nr:bacterial regulatory s, gntR family protein [Latilactobacillus graminis DSM 20719]